MHNGFISIKIDDENAHKYKQYFDWEEHLYRIPSHRLLAILRAEAEGFVKIKIEIEKEESIDIIEKAILKSNSDCADQIKLAIQDSYKRLLEPAISNEILQQAKQKADIKAIEIFSENLKQLLLAAPLGEKRILAIDPGYKSGCKIVCLDEKEICYTMKPFIHTHPKMNLAWR